MKLIVVLFAVIGYASADCGCLKCSNNLEVAGEVSTGKQCGSLKVIYRTDGVPSSAGFYAALPALPLIVQKPAPETLAVPPLPLPVIPIDYNYKVQPAKPACVKNEAASFYSGMVYPVKVQAPAQLPAETSAPGVFSLPLVGLKACADRIVVPAPPNYRPKWRHTDRETNCRTTCTTRQISTDGCGSYDSFGSCGNCGGCGSSCSCRYNITISIANTTENVTTHLIAPTCDLKDDCHRICKRQLPIIDHGFKFMMNMLPKFIQDPLKHTVNTIALTHPDKRIQQIQQAVPKIEKEKKKLERKNEMLQRRLDLYKKISPTKSRIINSHLQRKEVPGFIDSLLKPGVKKMKRYPSISPRFEDSEEYYEKKETKSWLNEYTAREIIGNDLECDSCSEEHNSRKRMTPRERLMYRLRKIDQRRLRRSLENDEKTRNRRATVVIDSEELSLPIYKVKVKEDITSSEEEGEHYEDDSYEEKAYKKPVRIEAIKKVIRSELKKLKVKEETAGSPFQYNEMVPKSPIVHLLTLPGKFLGGFDKDHEPSILSFPRMIVGTKRYFRDFGKNLRRNFLNFASDVIGDFEPPVEAHGLHRHKRSLSGKLQQYGPEYSLAIDEIEEEQYNPQYEVVFDNKELEQYQPEYEVAFNENDEFGERSLSQNFLNASATEQNFRNVSGNKVRKKRYVLSMVNEDDVEKYLVKKLEKIFAGSEEEERPRRRRPRKHYSYSQEEIVGECQHCRRNRKKLQEKDNTIKKIVVEKVRPKVIIDNKGLPFMEIDGYKRPLFLKKEFKHSDEETVKLKKTKNEIVKMKLESSSEDEVKYVHYDSSEEVTCDKIHHILTYAQGSKSDTEVPLQTIRERASQILYETDVLIHMDFGKYAEVFDQLIELQYVKRSIVQDWKRLIMSKKCNCKESKLSLLQKFKDLHHLKDSLVKLIVCHMNEDVENTFIIRKFTRILIILQKLQCIMNQVVECFENKFARDLHFEIEKDIKFVDILDGLKFCPVKTRHEIITRMEEERNQELAAKMTLLDKLKKVLINDCDDSVIIEQAHLVWEMRNLEKMQVTCIEEMHEKLQEGYKIKKNLKILFDISKRLQTCHDKQCSFFESEEEVIEEEEDEEIVVGDKEKVSEPKLTVRKWSLEEIKLKIEEKVKQHKELLEKRLEKYRKGKCSKCSDEKT
ncbi:unnamed protein product [Acanthoscelides obtectus]|uniref:Uncharacterized protein n=2 Tax=Acanthoscelides obtectus TaxID=200917 RepID=A0A9P0JSS6_ACAOB|nr:unnamed protein product [Acanthoscelides obtectus]CAK1663707.1 hypothetical protein AOBTE_LOCUS23810 [Acanthoscelides obtectus]